MKKLYYLIVLTLILGLVLTGCLLSNVGQVPTSEQSGITYLTKNGLLSDDLVGLWHFDGDTLDSSGNFNDGTLMGDTNWTSGKFGSALNLDGTEDYVSVDDSNSLDITTELTIEAWVQTDVNISESTQMQIVDKGEHQYYSAYMLMIYNGDLYGRVNKNNATACIYEYPNDGEWHHVAYTFKSGEQKLYIDGSNVASNTGSATITPNSQPLLMGRGVNRPQYCWNGAIDEVRIWKVALLPNQFDFYGFDGLLPPYVETKAFKIGSSIPLKWHYTDLAGIVVDSLLAIPRVRIVATGAPPPEVTEDLIIVDDPGKSGLRYDSTDDMWIFNWQTKECDPDIYDIYITSFQTGQTNGPFPIKLR